MIRVIAVENRSPWAMVEEDGKYFTVSVYPEGEPQPPADQERIFAVLGNNPEIVIQVVTVGVF